MSAPFLFVGGSIDGRVLNVEDMPQYFKVPIRPTPNLSPTDGFEMLSPKRTTIQTETYKRSLFASGSNEHIVYIHESIEDPMRALIEGYRQPKEA